MRIVVLLVAAAALAACEQEPEFAPDPSPVTPQANPAAPPGIVDHPITQAEYDRVTPGMPLDQVLAIIGEGCTPSATTGSPGQTMQTYVCINNPSLANAVLSFENGALVAKSSTGDLDALQGPPPT